MVACTAPAPPGANVTTVVVGCGVATEGLESPTKVQQTEINAPKTIPRTKTADATIQLTEDERSFVLGFKKTNTPAVPTDTGEEQEWQDTSSPAATAAQLAAVTSAAVTVPVPALPVVLSVPEEGSSSTNLRAAAQTATLGDASRLDTLEGNDSDRDISGENEETSMDVETEV
jgi:hypothetical protein